MNFPVCHFELAEQKDKNVFVYLAEGEPYLKLRFDTFGKLEHKPVSDGDILPDPFLEQMVFVPEQESALTMECTLWDAAVMRKGRAGPGQAILSQQGKPLIYGVNGLYDFATDTLITWHGFEWRFEGSRVIQKDGRDYVKITGPIPPGTPVVINSYFQYYRKHLGFEYHEPRKRRYNAKSICGWASWEAHHAGITPELIEGSADFLAQKLKAWGLEYIQIDDGYQSTVMPPEGVHTIREGWLTLNEKFPGGHVSIVKAILEKGFQAGIWTNAVINNETYAVESGRCITGKDGNPLKVRWLGYVFDCTDESVREICDLFRELAAGGYTYFKVDAIRHLIYDGLFSAVREGLLSNEEASRRFRNYMGAIRRGIGDENYLLSCWGVLSPNAGIADAMRFATDAAASDESLLMQIDESARWHFTHGVLYRNDPDYICLNRDTLKARLLSSLVSLNGYLYMISDDVRFYTEEKLEIARKTMPPTGAITAETGPLNCDTPMNYYAGMIRSHDNLPVLAHGNVWVTHFILGDRNWAVVQILRPSAAKNGDRVQIPVTDLALDPAYTYEAFDFWEQRSLGKVKGILNAVVPDPFSGRVIALTPLCHDIELIGTSRHVSMDVVSVKNIERDDDNLILTLEGVPGESFDYWFTGPANIEAACGGAELKQCRLGDYLKCSVAFTEKQAELSVRLAGK
jgi:alpha-galactosidase